MSPPVTMQMIAKKAGVSVMTVSSALRNSPRISARRRRQIQQIAENMGYHPNPLISALMKSRRTSQVTDVSTIALIDGRPDPAWLEQDAEWQPTIAGIKERTEELGHKFEWFNLSPSGYHPGSINRILKSRGIRSVIFAQGYGIDADVVLEWDHFVCVKLTSLYPKVRLHRVDGSFTEPIRLAINKLCEYGYERIGLVIPKITDDSTDNAMTGIFNNYQSRIPSKQRVPACTPFWPSPGEGPINDFIKWYRRYQPDAIIESRFFEPDEIKQCEVKMTISLRHKSRHSDEIKQCEIKIPDDVAWARLSVEKTDGTIAGTLSPWKKVGRAAVDLIVEQLYTNSYGLPDASKTVTVHGAEWIDGVTVPVKKQ